MLIATALVTLSVAGVVAVTLSYDGRQDRTSARAPQAAEPGATVEFSYVHRFATLGGLPLSVLYIDPSSESAQPPPGVSGWPDEGTTAISPALRVFAEEIAQRYGPVSGTIDAEGLGSPTERLIYFRPADKAIRSAAWLPASGYGNDNRNAQAGEIWQVQPVGNMVMLILITVFVPALILLGTVAQLSETERTRRQVLLEALGATPRMLISHELRTAAPFVLGGGTITTCLLAGAAVWSVSLPGVQYSLYADDIRNGAVPLTIGLLGGLAISAAVVVLATRPKGLRVSARPLLREPRYAGLIAGIGAVTICVFGIVAQQQAAAASDDTILWFYAGTLATIALSPWICGWCTRQVGRLIHAYGESRHNPSAIVAGAQISRSTRGLARQVSLTVVTMFLISQASVVNLLGLHDSVAAEAAFRQFDGRFALIGVPDDPEAVDQLPDVINVLPTGTPVVQVLTSFTGGSGSGFSTRHEIRGAAPSLKAFNLEPGSTAGAEAPHDVAALFGIPADGAFEVSEGPFAVDDSGQVSSHHLLVGQTPGKPIDAVSLAAGIQAVVVPGWPVGLPGADWRTGAALAAFQSRWIAWFGLIGAGMLVAAGAVRASRDSVAAAKRIAPLGAVTGNTRLLGTVAGLRSTVVAVVGCTIGGIVSVHFSNVIHIMGLPSHQADTVIVGLIAATVAATAAMWLWARREGLHAAHVWKPGLGRL